MIQPKNDVQEQVRQQLVGFSLTNDTMAAFVHSCVKANDEQRATNPVYLNLLAQTGAMVIAGKKRPPNADLKNLILELNEALNIDIATESLDPSSVVQTRRFRTCFSAALFVFVSYLVLGGIWSGDSSLSDNFSRLFIYISLACLIATLAGLEGTQLSVTILKLKELESSKKDYPNTYALHKLFKTDAGTKKYLAGRQLLVIVIVFCIAQLLSFPEIQHWPLTEQPLPNFFYPWIHLVLFKLGILGAVFVLWFGQLIPQFLAASNPQRFLNWPGMGLVLKAAWFAETLGLTQPVDWLTKNANIGEKIRPSNKELYFETSQNMGYALLSLNKKVVIKDNQTRAVTVSMIQILTSEHDLIVDDSVSFEAEHLVSGSDEVVCHLIRGSESHVIDSQHILSEDKLDRQTGTTTRVLSIVSEHGTFKRNDLIKLVTSVELTACEATNISIKTPTRYTHFSLEIHDQPTAVKAPSRLTHKWDAIRNGFYQFGQEQTKLTTREDNGVMQFEHSLLFPKPFTKHLYSWEFNTPD